MTNRQKRNIIVFLLFVGFTLPFTADAQYFRGSRWWKEYRKEITFAIGTSQVLTDLGGRDKVGSDFIYDMEINKTRYAASLGYRYMLTEKVAVRGNLSYAMLQGDDALTKEQYRNGRNLNFKTPIVEGAALIEYHFTQSPPGHRYKLKGARGKKNFMFGTYGFVGIGGFFFDPRANDGTRLYPLHTSGQDLGSYTRWSEEENDWKEYDAPKQYKRINMSFPVGVGIRYGLDTRWSVGLRFGWRFTTTDYIDDVSSVYPDKDAYIAKHGAQNYNRYVNPGLDQDAYADPGGQRGDITDRDNYGFAQVTFNYKLVKKKKYGRSRRIKTRKSMPSF